MSRIIKRSVTIAGHSTSLSNGYDAAMAWEAAVEEVDAARPLDEQGGNLSSALRVYLFEKARNQT